MWYNINVKRNLNHDTTRQELLDDNITRQVFVRTKNGGYDISFMINFTRREFIIGLENVTQWMPIPKLPKEQDIKLWKQKQ